MAASPMTVPWRRTDTTIELAVRRPRLGPALVISSNIRLESRPCLAAPDAQGGATSKCAPDARRSERKGGGAYTPPLSLSTRVDGVGSIAAATSEQALPESRSAPARRKRPGARQADSQERKGGAGVLFFH